MIPDKKRHKNRITETLFLLIIMCLLAGCNKPESISPKLDSVKEPGITAINEADNTAINNSVILEEEQPELAEEVVEISPDSDTDNNIEETPSDSPVDVPAGSQLQVHFVDVGQGDCSLIICDGEAMLIDAGDNDKGTRVQKYLKDQGISNLKYVIGTHPDSDHIGGLDVVIYKFSCDNILMPDATSDTKTYLDVLSAIDSKGYKITTVGQGDKFNLGSASFEILSPVKGHPYAEDNNNSIVLRLDYYNNSFLFMGDAEYQPQQVMIYDDEINAKADVVKVSHHGANSGYMKGFYDEVDPKYAVISCGKGNKYGHPHSDVLNDFKNRGVCVFRTDEQGTIVAVSDGNNIVFNKTESTTWAVGEPISDVANANDASQQNTEVAPVEGIAYVLNTNSMKFHYPTCDSVKDMKQKNRLDITCAREVLLEQYPDAVPCKRCNP